MSNNSARLALLALVSVFAVALSACGDGPEPQARDFDLEIRDQKLTLDPAVIKVDQGDTVTLRIGTDENGRFHLHGYDIEVDLDPNEPARMEFAANATGKFKITFHGGDEGEHKESSREEEEEKVIASLEVRPR